MPVLLDLAAQLEAQRDHVLGKPHREKDGLEDDLLADANKQKDELGEEEKAFTSLGADAELDQVIYDGSSFGTATFAGSDEEADYLGLPGLLDADQMRALLRQRQQTQVEANSAKAAAPQTHGGSGIRSSGHGRSARCAPQGAQRVGGDERSPHW